MIINRRRLLLGASSVALLRPSRLFAQPGPAPGQSTVGVPYIYAANAPYNVVANGTDQTTGMQSALNAASSNGAIVVLPLGAVVINGTGLSVPAGVGIMGQINPRNYQSLPSLGSILTSPYASYGTGTNPVLTLAGGNTLEGFSIWGAGNGFGSSTSRPNITLSAGQVYIRNVAIENGYQGINHAYQAYCTIDGCSISANQYGSVNAVNTTIANCLFSANGQDVFASSGASAIRIINNRFELCSNGPSINLYGTALTGTVTTNGSTTSGTTLHFASTTAITNGYQAYDTTSTGAIGLGNYVVSGGGGGTTVTLNAAVLSTVGGTDVIEFYLPNLMNVEIVGNQFDRTNTNAIAAAYSNHITVTGNAFRGSGSGATANTSGDAHVYLTHTNAFTMTGNTIYAAQNVGGGGTYSPSWGVWDGGANFLGVIKQNNITWNPVNGTNGGGINSTSTFSGFNTDNTITQANTITSGYP